MAATELAGLRSGQVKAQLDGLLTGISKNTLAKLLRDAGEAFSAYQDRELRNLRYRRLQLDEIWSFVYAKARDLPAAKAAPEGAGDTWTWTAIDADTKLIASWYVGNRDAAAARCFVENLAGRLAGRAQVTADGLRLYVDAVERALGSEVDFAQLVNSTARPRGGRGATARPSASGPGRRPWAAPRTRPTSRPATPSGRTSTSAWATGA